MPRRVANGAGEVVEIGKRGKNLHTKIIIHLYILTSIISRKRAVIKHKALLDSITTAFVECGMWEGQQRLRPGGKLGIFRCVLPSRFGEFKERRKFDFFAKEKKLKESFKGDHPF